MTCFVGDGVAPGISVMTACSSPGSQQQLSPPATIAPGCGAAGGSVGGIAQNLLVCRKRSGCVNTTRLLRCDCVYAQPRSFSRR